MRIDDSLQGNGSHSLQWAFHCAPGVAVSTSAPGLVLAAGSDQWLLRTESAMAPVIDEDSYSPSYGVAVPSVVVSYSITADLGRESQWRFVLERLT